ncbi:hypothetical protein EDB92DRAFT_1819439 [Lactarius akahatsu]|uniref:Fungal STAND N-terminal Goodbye domain-containing protein n=1 Tax=Lactarius akahatsu TaxID=416441 RepID=A0AAD4Q726_9AGAM|nr:hypothetical protein EDB92DRAFT_1819439 [Lactarius akahatsu]
MSNFQSILDALDKYAEQTGIDLNKNPFTVEINGCDSPDAVLRLLQVNLEAFEYFRNKNRKFIDCLSPVVQFVHSFSGILGEAAGLTPFQPAKLIFVGINVLFTIMVELISILALARKQISQGRFKQFAKKLLGDTKIEKILRRLDRLTQEEARMTVAQTLAIVHGLLDNMKVVMDGGEASTGAIQQTLGMLSLYACSPAL